MSPSQDPGTLIRSAAPVLHSDAAEPATPSASAVEGTTIPVVGAEMNPMENGAGLAVATVLVPPSEPPGSLRSGALPEAAGALERLGARKASFRKLRAARFNPLEGMEAVRQHSRTPLFSGRSQKQ